MSGSIRDRISSLFGEGTYVCGGHGARWPSDPSFTVPSGITIHFYVPDGDSLSNAIGQRVDQVLTGGTAPTPTETVRAGAPCYDYRLFSSKAGGYLNLAMSSSANPNYITEADKDTGRHLSEIITWIQGRSAQAVIHWSACRSLESGTDSFDWSRPEYSPGLLGLGGP